MPRNARRALLTPQRRPLTDTITQQLQASAPQDVQELLPHLQARGDAYARDAAQQLTARGEAEASAMREILDTQQKHIATTVARHESMDARQLLLDFGDHEDERRQREANKRYWARRLAMLEEEGALNPSAFAPCTQCRRHAWNRWDWCTSGRPRGSDDRKP